MSQQESVTEWIEDLKRGEPAAAQRLWNRYVEQLIRLARTRLGRARKRVADEEDAVVVAFAGFCKGVADGRFSRLDDRHDVWQILVMLTERAAVNQIRRIGAVKRGAGRVRGESVFARLGDDSSQRGMSQVEDGQPTPAFAVQVAEQLQQLLEQLEDDVLRTTVLDKLAGYTNTEIAARQGVSLRGIERQLQLVRRIWIHQGKI